MESKKISFFNTLSFTTLLVTLFLSLFFFIPFTPVTLDASKGFLLSIGATLALFFWLIARLGEGKFSFPKDKFLLVGLSIPVIFLISAFFSPSKYISLFGSGFEVGTFGSMLVLFIIFFLSSIYFSSEARLRSLYQSIIIGSVILAAFEIINMFLGFGRFGQSLLQGITAGNLVGSWNDFALFSGLLLLISLSAIEFVKSKKVMLFLQYFVIVASLLFLVIINLPLAWILVGAFSIIIFVYSISTQQVKGEEGSLHRKKFPLASLFVVFISLIFLIGSNSIGALISNHIRVDNIDVRPLASTTSHIAWKSIKHNPVFGTGPNTFNLDWALWQSPAVAGSAFWNVDFTNGYSSLFTFLVTAGILGALSLLAFIGMLLVRVFRSLKKMQSNPWLNYFTITTLVISVYTWALICFYTPNFLVFAYAFASSGILVGILVHRGMIGMREFSFLRDPRSSFFSILGLMVLMIVTLSTTYVYAEKFASLIYFSKSTPQANTIDALSHSERMLTNAILLDKNDVYYRSLSQIYIAEIGILLNDKSISADTLKSNVQRLVSLAESSANEAVNQNPKQYQNHMNLGSIYTALVPLSVTGSYESAVGSYEKARVLAPNNPSILLARASLELANKDTDAARKFITQATDMKPDYTDAIFLLAQIDTNEGNLGEAIKQAERASTVSPNDATVFFRLGLLRYNNADYTGAVSAFERAVILDPKYLNARYMLGQAYIKVGRKEDAKIQFTLLSQVLPDNEDVKNALNSLSSNQAPAAPAATTPAKTTKPPLSGQR